MLDSGILRADQRKTGFGGVALFGDYVELKLKRGDRLCTNADVVDTHGLRDIPDAKYPVKLTFFRTSAATSHQSEE